jgi:ethanolamine utilization protein
MDEKLLKQIVDEVLKEVARGGFEDSSVREGYDKLLVVGDMADVPAKMRQDYQLLPVDDYMANRNVHRYQGIVITALTLTQLSDIAQGRDGSPESCAVVNALLAGINVCMTEGALPHRKYAGKSSSRMYQVIENNVRLIQTYGVKLLGKDPASVVQAPARPPKYQAPPIQVPGGSARPNSDCLITEGIALQMIAGGARQVTVSECAIITPSAWDIFNRNDVEVLRQ